MASHNNDTPMNDEDMIQAWAKQPALLDYIRNHGWAAANRRRHGVTSCARTFANEQYAAQDELRQGFFEGVAFALLADLRVADIRGLTLQLTPPPITPAYDTAMENREVNSDPVDGIAKETTTADGPHDDDGFVPPEA